MLWQWRVRVQIKTCLDPVEEAWQLEKWKYFPFSGCRCFGCRLVGLPVIPGVLLFTNYYRRVTRLFLLLTLILLLLLYCILCF